MSLILVVIISIYCVLLILLHIGWKLNETRRVYEGKISNCYTVVIPFRNEQDNIPKLLYSLQHQNFPVEAYEVILVNDHSDDTSAELIEEFMHGKQFSVSLLHLRSGFGKKKALLKGIQAARGSVIITTDADCSFGANWLRSIAGFYEKTDAHMVTGPVTFEKESSLFEKLQTIEFASLIGAGAASLALKMPNMCNGANLSFRKTSFFEVGGYEGNEHIASGDDEFLMHKFWEKFKGKVYFNKSGDAVVRTKAHTHWGHFFQQRKRWASKWRFYSSINTSALAVFILFFNISFIIALGLLVSDVVNYALLLAPVALKVILESTFLFKVLKFLNKRLNFMLFIFLQFTYPFYVIIFGIAANFGEYRWKGRKH